MLPVSKNLLPFMLVWCLLGCVDTGNSSSDSISQNIGVHQDQDKTKEPVPGCDSSGSTFDQNPHCHVQEPFPDLKSSQMAVARVHHTATVLKDGRVLVVGGGTGFDPQFAEIYDPEKNHWIQSGAPVVPHRGSGQAVLLDDGRVLIAGGAANCQSGKYYIGGQEKACEHMAATPVSEVEIFDPQTLEFSLVGNLPQPRGGLTMTLLSDGKVLILGGTVFNREKIQFDYFNDGDLFDPETNRLSIGYLKMQVARAGHTATLRQDGALLIVGGMGPNGVIFNHSEAYVGQGARFTYAINPPIAARAHHSSALLENGGILLYGGVTYQDGFKKLSSRADLFMAGGASTLNYAKLPRDLYSTSTLQLVDGRVVLVGGGSHKVYYDVPGSETVTPAGSKNIWSLDFESQDFKVVSELEIERSFAKVVELNDGSLLVTGGVSNYGNDSWKVEKTVERVRIQ